MPTFIRSTALALACTSVLLAACSDHAPTPMPVPGDAERGRQLLQKYGCGACHQIHGVTDAIGLFGPPIERIGKRVYLAGALPNTPDNMARWIMTPPAIKPGTLMPDLHVSEVDARDMVAYLYKAGDK